MENTDDEAGEDDAQWTDIFTHAAPGSDDNQIATAAHRVIVHFDLDCFYAQVEMIRNPALKDAPLGIQQKNIVVTCNYVAREQGVTKLMFVTDAMEKCPQLVLVNGEDLTHYREMSYKVTELLMSYCPLVERLGFDENFMDVTEMVERRLTKTRESHSYSFKGHVYNHINTGDKASVHQRLALGSHVAAEMREAIHSKLGLTGCAGIATNKLLAKLVSGTFKPNQQTTLLPEDVGNIMSCLSSLRKVPGVGHQTAKRLQTLGLVSVRDLQLFSLAELVREFGSPSAQRLKNLALGVDDSPVTPTGAPQSLSDEDSFKKISSTEDVSEKIQELLKSLLERMHKDGRQPHTFRLTIRRYSATNKWFSRESRQCPIPNHIRQKIPSGSTDSALFQLLPLAMKLFHKMVDVTATFHLTLINVCFSNLHSSATATGKGSITSFFSHRTSPRKSPIDSTQSQDDFSQSGGGQSMDHPSGPHGITQWIAASKNPPTSGAVLHGFTRKQSPAVGVSHLHKPSCSAVSLNPDETCNISTSQIPPNVDPEVFKDLPEEIQKELLYPAYSNSLPTLLPGKNTSPQCPSPLDSLPQIFTNSQNLHRKDIVNELDSSDGTTTWNLPSTTIHGEDARTEGRSSLPGSSDSDFPVNVDPKVFSELPLYVQRELISEWKQHKPVLKAPSSKKPGRNTVTKEKKTGAQSSQANSLLKYFKPS